MDQSVPSDTAMQYVRDLSEDAVVAVELLGELPAVANSMVGLLEQEAARTGLSMEQVIAEMRKRVARK